MDSVKGGTLSVVAMPIGNPEDCSPRARRVLESADLILAEDTRRAGLAFQRLGVKRSGEIMSFFEHNENARTPAALAALDQGKNVALVSDAGTPLLSDPGYRLVAACHEAGIPVVPVPGPSAVAAALSACGLPPVPFTFLGFAPRRKGQLTALLTRHRDTGASLVIFERAERVPAFLAVAAAVLGPRPFCLAREMTKTYEEFAFGRLDRLEGFDPELRGEATLVIGPGGPGGEGRAGMPDDEDTVRRVMEEERAGGGKPRQVAKRTAARLSGWTADQVYEKLQDQARETSGSGDSGGETEQG